MLIEFLVCSLFVFFFFKQKTAYEMRISDWSSDVYSSDLTWVEPICFQQRTWSTHRHAQVRGLMGFAALYPSYDWVCGSVEKKMPALSRRHRVASSGGTLDQNESRPPRSARRGSTQTRSEELRTGKEVVSTVGSRWS